MRPIHCLVFCIFVALAAVRGSSAALEIDAAFPGGNILIDRIDGDAVHLRQDLRDTAGDWFYWAFRVRGAAGRTLAFTLATDKFSSRGPAISDDSGRTWRWLGRAAVKDRTFRHAFADDREVRFSLGMPYTAANLEAFLRQHGGGGAVRQETLCQTKKGRSVELLRFGQQGGEPRFRVFLCARHHACEMMANYELEGVIEGVLAGDDTGRWLRQNVEFRAVPFMDKDGVEDGDQGKNRKPHDHNRDYAGEPIYASVAAVKRMLPAWSGGRLKIAIDLHCPALRGAGNEAIQLIGGPEADFWQRATRFSQLLEKASAEGPLCFRERDNLPYGQSWNKASGGLGNSFGSWVRTVPGLRIGTTIELPYATANGQEVNAATARAFGRCLAVALRAYLLEDGN